MIEITIPGQPMPKARPRVVNGHAYTPKATVAAENAVAWAVKAALPKDCDWPSDALWAIHAEFHCGRGGRGLLSDGDNLVKLLKDALNGIVWTDDRQVVDVHYLVIRGAAKPRTEVRLWPVMAVEPVEGRG